jgi:DNA-binding NarL/FixJ family response regulator
VYDARVLRVVFAEDNYLVREGTVALLTDAGDVDIVGTAASFDELLSAVEELAPDAVLTDIRMPPSGTDEGIRAAKQIRADHADIGVVVLSQFADEEYAYDLLKDGAAGLGYLLKERVADVHEVTRALNNAAIAKELFLTERAVEKHINSMFHKLGLTEETDVHRRVMAVLAFLRETEHA